MLGVLGGITGLFGQDASLQQIKGLPTEEVYDLLADSRGFVWAGHSLGVSRFNGLSFENYSSPEETSSGMTDLREDLQGRIWCHNFNGQIFYVENERMHFLPDYKYLEESTFPRMVLVGGEMIASSERGLFICNTATLRCRYLFHHHALTRPLTLAVVQSQVIGYDGQGWIAYSYQNGMRELPFLNRTREDFSGIVPALQPLSTADTIYSKYEKGDIYKFVVRHDTVELVGVSHERNFINTISLCNNQVWIHTKKLSHTVDQSDLIAGHNLTDVVEDREGNTWYSSLDDGLNVRPKFSLWEVMDYHGLKKGDFIRSSIRRGGYDLAGTENGQIILTDRTDRGRVHLFTLPATAGSAENLFALSDSEFLVASSVNLYLINARLRKMYELARGVTVKYACRVHDTLWIARVNAFSRVSIPEQAKPGPLHYETDFIRSLKVNLSRETVLRKKRCFVVCNDSNGHRILVAFKDGLYQFSQRGFSPLRAGGEQIAASCLLEAGGRVYAGTFNKGIYVLEGAHLDSINTQSGLISNKILKMKLWENRIYIMETNNIQVMDVGAARIGQTITMPSNRAGSVYDLWKGDHAFFLAANRALYGLKPGLLNASFIPVNYLISARVNNREWDPVRQGILPNEMNNIVFRLSSPSLIYPEATSFRYRLLGNKDTGCMSEPGNERMIGFTGLKPGKYRFQATAINFQNQRALPITVDFEISRPVWQRWWFVASMVFCLGLLVYYLVTLRIKDLNQRNRQVVQELSLKNELRKSLLATIIAQMNPHFIFNSLNTIQSFVYMDDKRSAAKYMGKFSGLVRRILENSNRQSISLQEEIDLLKLYVDLEKMRFGNELDIRFNISGEIDLDSFSIPPMLVQPYVENAIVHGLFHKVGNKELTISVQPASIEAYITIGIEDNGIGRQASGRLNARRQNHTSFANSANEKRMDLINQTMEFKIFVQITDRQDPYGQPAGTSVLLFIPRSAGRE